MIPSMKTSRSIIVNVVIWAGLSGALQGLLAQAKARAVRAQIPFVGCESDGQVGPLKAPKELGGEPTLPAEIANRVAYYQAESGFGVLAPRGWHCYRSSGSSGSDLYVTPEPIDRKALKGFTGQSIQLSTSLGDTSGRFEVAKIIARVFPDHSEFVKNVIAEGRVPASSFPAGPYPTDKETYRTKNIVEFETPPNAKGLGTDSMLRANSSAIRGVAILSGEGTSLVHASIRLSSRDQDLVQTIIRQIEKEASGPDVSAELAAPLPRQTVRPKNPSGLLLTEPFEVNNIDRMDAILTLARRYHVPLGIEFVDEAMFQSVTFRVPSGDTIKSALDLLAPTDSGFLVTEHGNVFVISHQNVPTADNVLDTTLDEIKVPEGTIQEADMALLFALDRQHRRNAGIPQANGYGASEGMSSVQSTRIAPFEATKISVRDVLDRIVGEDGNAAWIVQVRPQGLRNQNVGRIDVLWDVVDFNAGTVVDSISLLTRHAIGETRSKGYPEN
jgi:hypothetical protein